MTTLEKVVIVVTLILFTFTVGIEIGRGLDFDKHYQEGYSEGKADTLEANQN